MEPPSTHLDPCRLPRRADQSGLHTTPRQRHRHHRPHRSRQRRRRRQAQPRRRHCPQVPQQQRQQHHRPQLPPPASQLHDHTRHASAAAAAVLLTSAATAAAATTAAAAAARAALLNGVRRDGTQALHLRTVVAAWHCTSDQGRVGGGQGWHCRLLMHAENCNFIMARVPAQSSTEDVWGEAPIPWVEHRYRDTGDMTATQHVWCRPLRPCAHSPACVD